MKVICRLHQQQCCVAAYARGMERLTRSYHQSSWQSGCHQGSGSTTGIHCVQTARGSHARFPHVSWGCR